MRRLIAATAAGLALATAAAGCGGTAEDRSADLFAVDRSGAVPGARLRLIVNDGGTATCNGGKPVALAPDQLIDARVLQRDLAPAAAAHVVLAPEPGSVLRYVVHTPDGTVRFADTSKRIRPAFQRLAYLVRRIAKGPCRLPR
jgi:hypothetical protein